MLISVIAFILLSTLCINGDGTNTARQYAQKPRGQMGFKWTRQYARQGQDFGSSYSNPSNTEQPQSPYSYGKGTSGGFGSVPPSNTDEPAISSTENTESTTSSGSTEEPVADPTSNTEEGADDIDTTNTNTDEPFEISTSNIENIELVEDGNQENENEQHQPPIMNCLYDKCHQSFKACFNDQQCKAWMAEWQENKSLRPECLPSYPSQDDTNSPSSTLEPEKEEFEEETFETTRDTNLESTENTESTSSTSGTEDTASSSTENTYDEDDEPSYSYSSTETSFSSSDVIDEEEETECEYNELFWNAYNCGVDNYCYADQLKLAQSHQYLLSPSNYRTRSNSTGSKSSSNDWTLLMVALTSGISAIIVFEVARRLYTAFQDKLQCQCVAARNWLRYLKNKWEQIRGYKYEKTHDDLDAIEESDDAEMYGRGSDIDETIKDTDTMGVTYNGPLNDDSDNSDDEELQRTSTSKAMSLEEQTDDDIIDDQFVHNELLTSKDNDDSTNDEQKDKEEEQQEIAKEPAQEL